MVLFFRMAISVLQWWIIWQKCIMGWMILSECIMGWIELSFPMAVFALKLWILQLECFHEMNRAGMHSQETNLIYNPASFQHAMSNNPFDARIPHCIPPLIQNRPIFYCSEQTFLGIFLSSFLFYFCFLFFLIFRCLVFLNLCCVYILQEKGNSTV